MSDLIERKKAIEAMSESLKRVFPEHRQIAEKCLNVLPSAQPESLVNESRPLVKDLVKDTISRTEAMNAVSNWLYDTQTTETSDEVLLKLPSAQHVPQWIPCSERLPDTRPVDEIGLFGEKCGEFMLSDPVLGYVCGLDDYVSMAVVWYEDDMDGVTGWTTAPDCMNVNVIAWMPLPEPYAERRTDETD